MRGQSTAGALKAGRPVGTLPTKGTPFAKKSSEADRGMTANIIITGAARTSRLAARVDRPAALSSAAS